MEVKSNIFFWICSVCSYSLNMFFWWILHSWTNNEWDDSTARQHVWLDLRRITGACYAPPHLPHKRFYEGHNNYNVILKYYIEDRKLPVLQLPMSHAHPTTSCAMIGLTVYLPTSRTDHSESSKATALILMQTRDSTAENMWGLLE